MSRPAPRGDRLLDQFDLARPGGHRRLHHRAGLHLGDARGSAHDQAGAGAAGGQHAPDEVAQHLLGDLEVRDHAVLQRPLCRDAGRCASEHALGLAPDRVDLARLVDGDHGRFVHEDPLPVHEHQGVRGAEVDGQVPSATEGA
jgi:hypothetical protein